jgi:hypothetical protein
MEAHCEGGGNLARCIWRVVGQKYATNAGREIRTSRSSREWANSGTMPKIAMRTAPPVMRRVPRIIQRQGAATYHLTQEVGGGGETSRKRKSGYAEDARSEEGKEKE